MLDQALELLIERRDPVRKAERAKARAEKKESKKSEQTKRPAPGQGKTRYIPARIRHQVYTGAEGQCSFVGENGRRCSARRGLHIDHIKPYAHGGTHDQENLRLLCPAHNRLMAPAGAG